MVARDVERSLRLARELHTPSAAQRERVRASLAARGAAPNEPASSAGGAAGGAAAGGAALGAGAALLKSSALAGLAKAALLVGAGFALGYWYMEDRQPASVPQPAPAAVVASGAAASGAAPSEAAVPAAPPAVVEHRAVPPAAVAPAPDPVAPKPAAAAEPAPATAVPSTAPRRAARRAAPSTPDAKALFSEELGLLQRAERAIRAGNGALARSFIADLEARFPRTALGEERTAVLVLASCAQGEPGAADAARAFLARHAGSVYIDRIRAMCALDAQPAAGTTPTSDAIVPGRDGSPAPVH